MLAPADSGIAVIADGDQVRVPVAVEVRELQLGPPAFQSGLTQTCGTLDIAEHALRRSPGD
jgi:hypothetical protein